MEAKVTKVKYVIQYHLEGFGWQESDWNKNTKLNKDLDEMIKLLNEAKRNDVERAKILGSNPKPYRLVKKTYSVTLEAVDA